VAVCAPIPAAQNDHLRSKPAELHPGARDGACRAMWRKADTAIALTATFFASLLLPGSSCAQDAASEQPGTSQLQTSSAGAPPTAPAAKSPPQGQPRPQPVPAPPSLPKTPPKPAERPVPSPAPPARPVPPVIPPAPVPTLSPMPEEAPLPTPITGAGGTASGGEIALTAPGAYLDSAVPMTLARFRFQDGFNDNFPNRGEFFYAVNGLPLPEKKIDFQEYREYFEYAPIPVASVFVEIPVVTIDPDVNRSHTGLGDINAGFKWVLLKGSGDYLTFQLRGYFPTGDASEGLGTGHYSVEPGLLYFRQFDRWQLQAELKDWIPIGGDTDFNSNVIEYGAGLGYVLVDTGRCVLTPVGEVVGWTFIGGEKQNAETVVPVSANGDTIVNLKPGVRLGWKRPDDPLGFQRTSLYAGWSTAITEQHLYQSAVLIELRYAF
jgi:hypothetical protein